MKNSSPPATPLRTRFWSNPFTLTLGLIALLLLVFLGITGKEWATALSDITADDTKVPTINYVRWGLWWAACVNAVLCAALSLTARWWAGSNTASSWSSGLKKSPGALSQKGWMIFMFIMAAAGALRWARMDLSFYNDEAHTFRRYIAGQNLQKPDGSTKWRQVTWLETAWLNKVGNNSPPFTLLSRLCYDSWIKVSGSSLGRVNETVVRLPAWITGMASLALLFFIIRRLLPHSDACYWLLLFASLHPWYLRYSTEARGYGLMLLGVTACFYFLLRASSEGRWRWWLAEGIAQFVTVWSFSGVIFFFVAFNGLILLWTVIRLRKSGDSWTLLSRPLFGMLLGAMLTLQLTLPSVIQLTVALRNIPSIKGEMGIDWCKDVAGGLLAGIRWVDNDFSNPQNLALERILAESPWIWSLLLLAVCLLGVGMVKLLKSHPVARIIILSAPIAILSAWLLLRLQGKFLHVWYFLYALPGLLLAWAAGAAQLISFRKNPMARRGLAAGLMLGGLSWGFLDWQLLSCSKENIRGLVEAIPEGALFGCYFSDADIYHPTSFALRDMDDLDQMMAKAQTGKKPLYISYARVSADPAALAVYARISQQPDFQLVQHVYGLDEEQFTHHLYRWDGDHAQ